MKQVTQGNGRESGTTLVELLVALAIIVLAVVVFIAALSTGSVAVQTTDQLTTANHLAAVQLESIKNEAYDAGGAYTAVSTPANYAVAITSAVIQPGLQQVTVTVSFQGKPLTTISNYKVNR
ncbi:MAG: hypothetical protein ACE5EY_00715 [Anaerolineae bacterium]